MLIVRTLVSLWCTFPHLEFLPDIVYFVSRLWLVRRHPTIPPMAANIGLAESL